MTTPTPTPALRLIGLSKAFGDKRAVDHIDLEVPGGSFFGLVGPNGAGKTTSLSMAVGLLRPDSGRAEIFGVDVWADPVRAKELIGVLPDGLGMPERLTGREVLSYLGLLRGMEPEAVAKRSQDLLEVLELDRADSTLVLEYSTGMRKKIGLATALLHAPKLLVLDEPLEAVDPVSAATIKVILQRFVAAGGSVVFSSHVMPVVEQLCDHVAVVTGGRVVASGPLDEVRGGSSLENRFVDLVGGQPVSAGELSWLAS
ncbi:ABC transporter ATP-binding protein [Micromonospora zamorensis]|uniref:ABC transporter ATP-binding protein n=1 Tax=Micromonospora zamorensis TaxID=709883 RepID=UPI00081FB9A4|nr:ABC transporter ATP-binding protein [Micromonospora zamorensis]WTE89070.1 ABC transporter ATP-binding protein [Micromonospora zamorensis]SCG47116.1 ABC-2 type transport system ATP-binding protein [Micromonospora zamorensis]